MIPFLLPNLEHRTLPSTHTAMAKELLVGLSEEDKREMISFMGLVNAQARNTLQVYPAERVGIKVYCFQNTLFSRTWCHTGFA